jgi:hypothetical protein
MKTSERYHSRVAESAVHPQTSDRRTKGHSMSVAPVEERRLSAASFATKEPRFSPRESFCEQHVNLPCGKFSHTPVSTPSLLEIQPVVFLS